MRGKESFDFISLLRVRITPAHAGKRRSKYRMCRQLGDHPRACGEKSTPSIPQARGFGSPPRMRGKAPDSRHIRQGSWITPAHAGKSLAFLVVSGWEMWITPAHAGKSLYILAVCRFYGDHPRACGEKSAARDSQRGCTGSPPRMRGKDSPFLNLVTEPRITPAHAGKSLFLTRRGFSNWDHPRACGEKTKKIP